MIPPPGTPRCPAPTAGEAEELRLPRESRQVVRAGDLVDHAAAAGGVGGYVCGGLPPRRPLIGDAASSRYSA
jgi:hypothetical protein